MLRSRVGERVYESSMKEIVRRITADWADVDHPIAKLDKCSTVICG